MFRFLSILIPFCQAFQQCFPESVKAAKCIVGLDIDKFKQFVVCTQCHALYDEEDCFQVIGSRRVPLLCSHVEFPDHTQPHHRRPCNGKLIREIQHPKPMFVPYHIRIAIESVRATLHDVLQRPRFVTACEAS